MNIIVLVRTRDEEHRIAQFCKSYKDADSKVATSKKTTTVKNQNDHGEPENLAGFQLMGTLEHFSERDRQRLGGNKKKPKKSSRKRRHYKTK